MSIYFYAEVIHGFVPLFQLVLMLVFDAAAIIGIMGIFHKAGRKPWHALIPGLHDYHLYAIAWRGWIGIATAVLKICMLLFYPASGRLLVSGPRGLVCLVCLLISLLLEIVMKLKLALSFRKNFAFGLFLIFLPQIFYPLLGFDPSPYLGPTLRSHNAPVEISEEEEVSSGRKTMVALYKQRSIAALVSALVVCIFTSYAVAVGLLETYFRLSRDAGYSLFKYFTTNSNTLSAIGAAFLIPYAVEGIRVKRFSFPKWVGMIQYSGAICTTLTMFFAFLFILPTQGKEMALGGTNFWLHLVCPLMALVLFLSVESDFRFTFSDSMICLTPFFIYATIYTINVALIGAENGGWQDLYHLADQLPVSFTAPAMCAFALGVALLISYVYNRLSVYRRGKMMSSWAENADQKEIEAEARDLGRHYGLYDDRNDMTIPVDILKELAEKYGVELRILYRAYVKGMDEGLQERNKHSSRHPSMFQGLFGSPKK